MKYKGLITVLLTSIFLISCDHPELRSALLTFGFIEPERNDIQYQDKYLDTLFSEINSLESNRALIKEEYDWVALTFDYCKKQPENKKDECLSTKRFEHRGKLHSILTGKLLSIQLEEQEVVSPKLPVDMGTLSIEKPRRFSPKIAYAPKAAILAYQAGDGRLHIADLKTGTHVQAFMENYSLDGAKYNLQLSENGRLLLTQYDKKIELVSTYTGQTLTSKKYSGKAYFTKNNRYILTAIKGAAVLLNSVDLELTGTYLEFSAGHDRMNFNRDTNTLVTWGLKSKVVDFYYLNEKELTFERKNKITISEIGRRRGHSISDVLLDSDGKSAYVLVFHTLFKLNLTNNTYYEFVRLPYVLALSGAIIKNDFIIGKGFIPSRKHDRASLDRYIDIVDLSQGKFSFVESSDLREAVFLPTPINNTIFVAKGRGVKIFEIEKNRLKFKNSEEFSLSSSIIKTEKKLKQSNVDINNINQKVKAVGKGKVGIDQALRLGLIRVATEKDMALWKSKNKNNSKILSKVKFFDRYVVLKAVKFSGGLSGANSVVFVAKNNRTAPYGSIGHSVVLFSDTGACKGFLCKNL